MTLANNLLRKLLDWDDKSEMYTRLALFTIPLMFTCSLIFNDIYHSPKIATMLIFSLMGLGIWLMVRRSKIESNENAQRSRS